MRILVDSNVLFSAILFPDSCPAQVVREVNQSHDLFLTDQNINEVRDVVMRKKPEMLPELEVFLASLSYELIPAIDNPEKLIRDATDQPILNSAILNGVEIIISGDKDFLESDLDTPKCMTPRDFLNFIAEQ